MNSKYNKKFAKTFTATLLEKALILWSWTETDRNLRVFVQQTQKNTFLSQGVHGWPGDHKSMPSSAF